MDLSCYEGTKSFGRFEGRGTFEFNDGTKYVGEWKNGQFHGEGTLYFAYGQYEALWENGREIRGQYSFTDGLEYSESNWIYCSDKDRRFHSEIETQGPKPAGQLVYANKPRTIPKGCYDAGDGVFDPDAFTVSSEKSTRVPDQAEAVWIKACAVKGVY